MQVIAFDLTESDKRQRYDNLFNACPHAFVQQSTYWADVIQDLSPDRPIFLLAVDRGRDVGGLPLYLFEGRPGPILTSVPHPGPLGGVFCLADVEREPVFAALLSEAAAIAKAHRCLALTLITSPLSDDIELYRRNLGPTVTFENFTQVVPIAAAVRNGDFCLPNNRDRNPGRTIRKAEAGGLFPKICSLAHEFEAWYSVHEHRHRELGLAPLQRRLLHRIWSDLGRQGRSFLQLVMSGEEIASGCLFIHHEDVCDAFIMSMASRFEHLAPNYLLTKASLLEMAKRGIKFMNWQSSARRNDGVYKFKKQWGSLEKRYYFVTKTYCSDATLLQIGKEGVKREYPDHFLVPFGVFDRGAVTGSFAKEA
jgi:Acetyltransferase (GNAT) domain